MAKKRPVKTCSKCGFVYARTRKECTACNLRQQVANLEERAHLLRRRVADMVTKRAIRVETKKRLDEVRQYVPRQRSS